MSKITEILTDFRILQRTVAQFKYVSVVLFMVLCFSACSGEKPVILEFNRLWEGDIPEFHEYIMTLTEADFEGIWDVNGNYLVGVIREDDCLIGFVIGSVYDDWLPNMVKFRTIMQGGDIKTVWVMRNHSVREFDGEPVLLGNNDLVVGDFTIQRLYPRFPNVGIDFSVDAAYLVDMIEKTHPIFILEGMLLDNYDEMREEYLIATSGPISIREFYLASQRYITALRDGHMNILSLDEMGKGIEMPFVYRDGRLNLVENGDVEVTKIGGVDVSEVFHQIERLFYFENDSMRSLRLASFVRFELMLSLAGAEIIDGNSVYITLNENGVVSTIKADLEDNITGIRYPTRDYIIRHEMREDIFYISLARFADGAHITEVVREIRKAIRNGTRKFIIDVRGNPGGHSMVIHRLTKAMGIRIPSSGWIMRLSDLLLEQIYNGKSIKQLERHARLITPVRWLSNGASVVNDTLVRQPQTKSRNRHDVFASVLTDKRSFSASTYLGLLIQDGGLGNVIGEPSSNSPNMFSELLNFNLPVSRIRVGVSIRYNMRPDINADPRMLHPDILVPADMALETAVEFLRGLER